MGIIQRQSIKNTIVNYVAVLLGAVNILFIYERLLSPEQLGQFKYIVNTSAFIGPFVILGINTIVIRFFPKFKTDDGRHNGLLKLALLTAFGGFSVFALISLLFGDAMPTKLMQNIEYILPLVLIIAISLVITAFISNFNRIVVPAIFNNLWIKVGIPALVALYFLQKIDFTQFKISIVLVYLAALIGLIFYLYKLGQFKPLSKIVIPNKKLLRDIRIYGSYSILGSLGGILVTQIDQFMVTEILDYEKGAIYTIAVFIGTVIAIPLRAILNISNPIISQSFEKGDMANIKMIYKESSINLLIMGCLILLLIWMNLDDLFELMSNTAIYRQGKYVVLFIGFAKLLDLATSTNGLIITHSRYFRFNFYSILFLAILNVFANYIFIQRMGIEGAAVVTLATIGLYNMARVIFIYWVFKIQPFSFRTVKLIALAFAVYFSVNLLPLGLGSILNILIKSIIIIAIYSSLVWILRISPKLNQMILDFIYSKNKNAN